MPDIDFVIAWVDGSDPDHAAARRRYSQEDEGVHVHATHETRFYHNGEIYYLIASILKYAPFVRRAYIITDNQKPPLLDSFAEAGLCPPEFLELVSHDVIFRDLDAARPTFNARSIEAAMWRVPGLSEHFVYSNDDMFLNAPISPDDLFRDGRPILHGEMVKPNHRRLKMRMRTTVGGLFGWEDRRPKHRTSQEIGARLAGATEDFFYTPHHPHPLRRSVIEKFYDSHPDVLRRQVKYRFRSVEQYNAVALANNLEIAAGGAIVEPMIDTGYLRPDKSGSPTRVLEVIRKDAALFGCVQSFELFSPTMRSTIHRMLREKFADTLPDPVVQYSLEAG